MTTSSTVDNALTTLAAAHDAFEAARATLKAARAALNDARATLKAARAAYDAAVRDARAAYDVRDAARAAHDEACERAPIKHPGATRKAAGAA